MESMDRLAERLRRLDGKSYRAYREIEGEYGARSFRLVVDHVQGDPFAEPSRLRALVPSRVAELPEWAYASAVAREATADYLNRRLAAELHGAAGRRGSGRSGDLYILQPGQEVLVRACLRVGADGEVEARFRAGLPARGRRILGRQASELLTEAVVVAVEQALLFPAMDGDALRRHVETVADARALRDQLAPRGLVAFVADGAALPRRSGVDDRPLTGDRVVPFQSPPTLRVTLEAPHAGAITGLGIPAGVTLIVGGGFHGKSTLLRACERGVYDHIPGDGREQVVTVSNAVKVRAEDGRSVAGADISNFIGRLPGGVDTGAFRTANASGSTSQAAAIVEALESGATCLLLDEDTSATNFMIRDARMQALIADAFEPITPFIDRAGQLALEQHVSTILVVGGSGDYFDVADTVIALRAYVPADVTMEARRVAAEQPTRRQREGGAWQPIGERLPLPASLDPSRGRRAVHVRNRSEERLLFGTEEVDLSAVEQLVEAAQTRAMGQAVVWARGRIIDGRRSVGEVVREIALVLAAQGLDAFQREPFGELAAFRPAELAAFLGRIRSLQTRHR